MPLSWQPSDTTCDLHNKNQLSSTTVNTTVNAALHTPFIRYLQQNHTICKISGFKLYNLSTNTSQAQNHFNLLIKECLGDESVIYSKYKL